MVSFAQQIRPLFREKDVRAMASTFDLSDYDHVRTHAESIFAAVSEGSMPCDGVWSQEWISLFKQWMDAGYPA